MKKSFLFLFLVCGIIQSVFAQVPGDTLITSTFNYTQTQYSRDSVIHFPDLPGVTYEKIYMLYNMRCKNGLISPAVQGQTNIGCGEWDYTCNTYVVDSTKTDSVKAKHPSHIITGFNGQVYPYTTIPTYTYYQYNQQNVVYTNTISETTATVGSGSSTSNAPLHTQLTTSKSQYVWTAAELSAAGLTAGNISSLRLNVSTPGSASQFLKVRMKHVTQSFLNASTPDISGFTEVYFLNTTFTNGINQLNFYNNFNWNGTDNILVEFSFSNASNGTDNIVLSDVSPLVTGLVSQTNDFCFDFNGSNQIHLGNANFANFSNEITISFWSYGNENILPQNTSVLYATNALNQRQANVHLPWSNASVYWDCGSGGPFDRIDKPATNPEFEGQWNHWAFTKNATTGIMNIYLNGTLWHTGSGKTLPVEITDFMLGGGPNMSNPYFGKMDEFSLWKTALSQATIQAWMNKSISPSHPDYANLVAYYPLNEGTGAVSADVSPANASAAVAGTPSWKIIKGKDIFKNFTETSNRPMVTFVQGVYTQTTTPIIVLDSVQNTTNTVYSFISAGGNILPFDTNTYYQAGYTYVYDGNTNLIIDSVNIASMGTINITQLDYYQKRPAAFQLVSFVTPYGINLDLGMGGKTWVFDVTDYAPILKGWKRMFINGGGERQEDMDIKFMYIVGTPPRDVKDINNIWRVDAPGYQSILNDDIYEPRDVTLNPNAVSFKIKSAITGHGQEGEFIPRTHWINIAGGAPEFSWDVWKPCAENPVYPQGGTWIYDRAGWCPGMATDVKEMDITPYVTVPGINNIDYGLVTASGSSNYWVSNQLVSYGAANFTLDAAIIDIKNPTNKVAYARSNPICKSPIIVIRNTGSTTLTSLTIEYWVNNNPVKEVFQWTGSLAFMESAEVTLPLSANLWSAVNGPTNNQFHAMISNPNNGSDGYVHNNTFHSTFNITNVVPSNFIIWFKTNLAGAESKYELFDESGNQIFIRENMANSTNYRDTFKLGWGCYSLVISDSEEDGIDFWANNDGIGFARLRTAAGGTIINFEGDFGKSFIYNFTVDYPLSYDDLYDTKEILVYPNPAQKQFVVEGKNIENSQVKIYNQIGQLMDLPHHQEVNKMHFNSTSLIPGFYFIIVQDENNKTYTRKLLIE
ncbi:MAG: T9SS type A sorting domain-containing protein [Bacteroidetes bacterium]|nr:T9SS type A sorting domain-containing protein [Bacteroidota bacterium]MBK6820050.1 T9SS type A sorting domain-containing protein [Bacteroidota bacterium]MBK8330692.1 T9SS type A sorting domain-containing protein [Bacteroidota bacterium]